MVEATKYSSKGDQIGKIQLPENIFDVEAKNPHALIYEVVKMYRANQRQGTSSVKFRSDVKGSGRKLFRQKGTGNARVGNRRTVVRVGGGNAFGPIPKDWYTPIPKKKKRLALKVALTNRARDGKVSVIEDLKFDKPSIKDAIALLGKIGLNDKKSLILIDGSDKSIVKSFSNIQGIFMDRADSVHAYEVLNCNNIVITESALKKVEEVFGK